MRAGPLALLLTACATTAPGGPPPLAARSASATGCAGVQVSERRAGEPAANLPERWRAAGCGRRFACETFLLASGEAAHTRCVEEEGSLDRRLRRVSAERAAETAKCPDGRVKVEGVIAEADARVYLVHACGRALRCVTVHVRDEQETTRCTELEQEKR
jgi:hypothetical protein